MRRSILLLTLTVAAAAPTLAQFQPQPVRIYMPTADERRQLDEGIAALRERLKSLPSAEAADAAVFLRAADMADRLRLYTDQRQVNTVLRCLDLGAKRAELLVGREQPWTTTPGRSLRGLVSRIDGSVQPYGVVLPAGFDPKSTTRHRLDVVLHGRGPTEVSFLAQNEPEPGSNAAKAPDQPFIELHPFGRGNNGWRWAGETDVFEALEHVTKQYRIDPDRIVLRGFSMGGHGAWHLGLHYADRWAAVSPGAGFSETRKYIKVAPGSVPEYQERMWGIYDAVDYALNLFNTPFVAYGGDKDPQLQAALNMKEAAEREGLPLTVIVGPDTEHRYHPESLKQIMADLATHRRTPAPLRVRFTTRTVKYDQCFWVRVHSLEDHYRPAVVTADASGEQLQVKTENVTRLTLGPLPRKLAKVRIDGQTLDLHGDTLSLTRSANAWRSVNDRSPNVAGPRKRHNLQGPIDDAFMDRFIVVRPTGTSWHESTGAYVDRTLARFTEEWRLGFRGELPVRDDTALSEADWKDANLVLFGDPASNKLLARVAPRLPLKWTREGVELAGRTYPAGSIPVLIFPSPLSRERYVVVNSGHTWTRREIEESNAYLTPKLPDWAVLKPDTPTPAVLTAGFFNERWGL